jgi:type IV secretion system protein VirD4
MGELLQAFACLSDSTLLESVSPPFDVSLKDLCAKDRAYQVYFMPPAEFVQAWAPVLKSLFVAGKVYKSRAPSAPPQTWVLDECAQLGGFPIVPQLFSIGAGQGIRPVAVFQNTRQMNALGPDAEAIITASAQARIYFAVRDLETASALSRMLGEEILEYRDEQRAVQLRHARMQAAQTLMSGGDPIRAGLDMAHLVRMERTPSVKARLLRAPDEVLSEPSDKMFLFVDGVAKCIHAERKPYYEQGFMAGRYHPNPYHPPADRVRVKTGWGMRWRKVVHEPVPARFKAYPQYRGGTWSRVQ